MRRAVIALGVLALVAAAFVSPPRETLASWGDAEHGRGPFTAGVVNPPRNLSCSGGGLLAPVTFSWAAPEVTANSLPVSGYHWDLTPTAPLAPAASGTVPGTSVTIPASFLAAGSSVFTVTATGPGGWSSQPGPTGTYSVVSIILGLVTSCSVP